MEIKKLSILTISAILGVFVLYAAVLLYLTWPIESYSIDKSGVFGDSFGLLTSLFSGLAFAGIIITILLQREELKHQREELKLQREEIAENRKELARTASAQEKSEEWFAFQARMMSLSALASLTELKMKIGDGHDRTLIDRLYKEISSLISNQNSKEK